MAYLDDTNGASFYPISSTSYEFDTSLTISTLTTKRSRGTVEAYHFQSLRHRKKVIRLNTLVPDDETFSNPRYVDVEERFDIPRRSAKVHDCRVMIGADIYLVTGYWYRQSAINRADPSQTSAGGHWANDQSFDLFANGWSVDSQPDYLVGSLTGLTSFGKYDYSPFKDRGLTHTSPQSQVLRCRTSTTRKTTGPPLTRMPSPTTPVLWALSSVARWLSKPRQ